MHMRHWFRFVTSFTGPFSLFAVVLLLCLSVCPTVLFSSVYAQSNVAQSTGPLPVVKYKLFACYSDINPAISPLNLSGSYGNSIYNPIILDNKTLQFDAARQTAAATIPICIASTYSAPTKWNLTVLPTNPTDPNNKQILPDITFDKNPIVVPLYIGQYPDQDVSMLGGEGKAIGGNYTKLNAFVLIPVTATNGNYSFEIQSVGNSTDRLITASDIDLKLDIHQAVTPEFSFPMLPLLLLGSTMAVVIILVNATAMRRDGFI